MFLCQAFRDITPSQSNNWVTSGVSGLSLHHSEQMHPELGPKVTQNCSPFSFEQMPHTALDLHHLTPRCQIQGLCQKVHSTELFNRNFSTEGKSISKETTKYSGKGRHFPSSQISRTLVRSFSPLLLGHGSPIDSMTLFLP